MVYSCLTSRRSQVRALHCPPIIFIHLVNLRIWRRAHTRGIYRGPLVNFAFCWPARTVRSSGRPPEIGETLDKVVVLPQPRLEIALWMQVDHHRQPAIE